MEGNLAEQNIRRYLLGELVEAERQRLEESLLTSSELFEELLIVEDELVDEYIKGRLTDGERESFEKHFLSTPERIEKLKFARAFNKHLTAATATESAQRAPLVDPHSSSWKQWFPTLLRTRDAGLSLALTMALMLGVLAGLWNIIRSDRAPEVAANRGTSSTNLYAITLTPGAVRDAGEMKRVVIPATADTVQLQLELATTEYESYRAALQTDEGREVFTGDRLKAESAGSVKIIALTFPAKLLTNGDYQVKLSGINANGNLEDTGRYYFRVMKG
jgi:hypothetical protein